MADAGRPSRQIGIHSGAGGDISIHESDIHIAGRDVILQGDTDSSRYEYCIVDLRRDSDTSTFYFSAVATGPDGAYIVAQSEKFHVNLFQMVLRFSYGPDQNDPRARSALNGILKKLKAEGWTDTGEKFAPCFGNGAAWWSHKFRRKV